MVKRFTFLVTGALLLLCTYAQAQQPTFTLSPAANTVSIGQTFTVNVSVSNFTNIASTQYAIGWNAAVIEFVSVTNINGTALPGFTMANFGAPGTGNVPNNRIFVSWNEPNFNGVNVAGGTTLFTITFRGLANGTSNIAFNNDPPGIEILNGNFVDVGMTQQNATATVGNGQGGGGGSGLMVTIADVNGMTGQQVCMNVSVQNFTNILGMQFSINYNPAMLQFAQITNINLAGLTTGASFGNPSPGVVTLTWNDPNVTGMTINNGTVIFSICFNVTGNASSNVTITGNPTPVEIIDGNEQEVNLTTESGTVTVGGGGTGGGTCSFSGFGLILEDVNGQNGQQVCMDVTVQGFTNILGMQFSINYDPNVLQFDQINNINLAGLSTGASFGTPAPGAITCTWNDPNVVGLSVGNGTTIFSICFNVIGNATTTVTFSGNPTPVEITDGNENPVVFNNCSGTVTIGGGSGPTCNDGIMNGNETGVDCGGSCAPCSTGTGGTGCPSAGCNINGFGLIIEDFNATAGQQVCVNVYSNNFTNILGMQFSINYNPNILQFDEATNFGLPGLVASNFGNPAPGAITFTWTDQELDGHTVANCTAIFTLCFNTVGTTTTTITFSGSPTPVEITDGNEQSVAFSNCSGTVTFGGGGTPTCNDGIMNGNETGVDCGGSCAPCNPDPSGCPSADCNLPANAFGMILEDVNAQAGQQVCVDVFTHNFTNILGMQFSINYDPNVLQFDEATNFGLPGLVASNFGNPAPGAITFTWTDQELDGHTVANCTPIFTLCFNTTGNTTTTITFSGSPTPIEITDGNEQSVAFNSCSGTVSFGGSQPSCDDGIMNGNETGVDCGGPDCEPCNPDPSGCPSADCNLAANAFGLILEDMNTQVGQQVCVDIFTHNFTNILGMQFSINYDPNTLQFVQATNFGLPGLAGANFGNPAPGAITFTWTDQELDGHTVANCTSIFTLCFNVTGGNGTQSTITFSGSPTPTEITDGNEQNVAFNSCTSTICIGNCMGPTCVAPQVSETVTNVKCRGESSGSVNLQVIGTGPFTFQWGGVASAIGNVPSATGLSVGTATVTVTDIGACNLTSTKTFTITEPLSALTALVTNQQNVFCPNDPNGAITVTAAGGTAPYFADWCCNLTDNDFSQTGLMAGTYSVTVSDNNGCTKVISNIQIQAQNNPITINASPVPIPQGGGGAINVSVSGGTGNLSFNWDGPNNFDAGTEDISNLNNPGEYCLRVTDAAGCIAERCVFLPRELVITNFLITKPCPGAGNGAIDVSVQGGVEPITYKWTRAGNPAIIGVTQDISNLSTGMYLVMVSDASGQQITGTFEVSVNNPVITPTIVPADGGNNGSITLNVQGGNTGYNFNWGSNGTGASITGLAQGEYCVTVTYQTFCSYQNCYTVPGEALALAINSQTGVDCFGNDNGTLTINIKGGAGPYTVTIGEDTYQYTTLGNHTITDIPGGAYEVVLSDSQGNMVTKSVTIAEPDPIAVDVIVVHDTEDTGCTGNITLDISGGTPTYNVVWNSPVIGPQIVVCEGTYNAVITDSKGCQATIGNIAVNTFGESALVKDADCEDDENGAVTLTLTGGKTPYNIKWRQTEGGPVIAQGMNLPNLGPGIYFAEITEASGNVLHRTYTVGVVSDLRADAAAVSDFNGFDVSCSDASDGLLEASATGQSGPVSYEWLLDGSVKGTNATLNNASAGIYTLRVFDDNCTLEREIEVTAPAPLALEVLNIKPTECKGERNGEIVVQASGGVTTQPYLYRWANNDFGPVSDFLPAGTHTVSVTDANECVYSESFIVPEPELLEVVVETEPATEECNGVARAVVTGGNPPYSFNWLNLSNQTSEIVTGLCPGDYQVEVIDFNGCQGKTGTGKVADKRFPCLEERVVITPDGNGSNDEFIIFCIDELVDNHLEIYNRWGQLVYETDDYLNNWEGTSQNGDPLPEGPYYFILEYLGPDNELIQVKGSISLLRD